MGCAPMPRRWPSRHTLVTGTMRPTSCYGSEPRLRRPSARSTGARHPSRRRSPTCSASRACGRSASGWAAAVPRRVQQPRGQLGPGGRSGGAPRAGAPRRARRRTARRDLAPVNQQTGRGGEEATRPAVMKRSAWRPTCRRSAKPRPSPIQNPATRRRDASLYRGRRASRAAIHSSTSRPAPRQPSASSSDAARRAQRSGSRTAGSTHERAGTRTITTTTP